MVKDLREYLKRLEKEKELIRVKENLSTSYEIPAAMKYIGENSGLAVLFEKPRGYKIPVVGNLLGTRKSLAIAMETNIEKITQEYLKRRLRPIKPRVVKSGPVKDTVITRNIDIMRIIPVLTHHEKDAGPYFTSAITISKDPENGMRGMGIHRIQVKGKNKLGIYLGNPPLARFLKTAEERNQPLEVAVAIGVDIITWFSSVIWAPSGIDKFDIAGGLSRSPVPLVKCETVNVDVPAYSEFVIEGRIPIGVREKEGPFGESSGYYLTFDNPVIEVTAICHRKKPVYHALMPFTGEESVLSDVPKEADDLESLKKIFPYVKDLRFICRGSIVAVQVDKKSEDIFRMLEYVLGMEKVFRIAVAVDTDVDIHNMRELAWAVSSRLNPDTGLIKKPDMDGWLIDPAARAGKKITKLAVDATKPLSEEEAYEKIKVPEKVNNKIKRIGKKYLK